MLDLITLHFKPFVTIFMLFFGLINRIDPNPTSY
jgi:hypothetical protein